MMLHQSQVQKQQLKILPQQIQLLSLFHLNTLELEEKIKQEMEENPFLDEQEDENKETEVEPISTADEVTDDYTEWDDYLQDDYTDSKNVYSNYLSDDFQSERPFVQNESFQEMMKRQVTLLVSDDKMLSLAYFLIDSIDEKGFLEEDAGTLAEIYSFKNKQWVDEQEMQKAIEVIKSLEPAGIGAQSVCECLIIQLQRLPEKTENSKKALCLLENYYADLKNRNMPKIKEALGVDDQGLKDVLHLIGSLNMHPVVNVSTQSSPPENYITPDFILSTDGDKLHISLNRSAASSLCVNYEWMESIPQNSRDKKSKKAAQQYFKSKINDAKWFISAIQQRESSMLKIMEAIAYWQKDYFKVGDVALLKPMILKDIAQVVDMDISSVSRITSNKYVSTPFGLILLKDLFNEGMPTVKGEIVSSYVIKTALEEIIEKEDKKNPFTDQQLVKKLLQGGYLIARRTVAKYREIMNIPTAQIRSVMSE